MQPQTHFPKPAVRQNPLYGKCLDDEIYVAREVSATLPRSYAPQSNFSGLQFVSLPWTPGTEVLSNPHPPGPQPLAGAAHR